MQVKAILRNLRIAPRKTRDVIDLIRGKGAPEAQTALSFTTRKSAPIILKLLNSAIASAENDFKLKKENLFVAKVFADEGTRLKRWHPMSRGRAYPIEKRTSHITIVLDTLENKIESKRDIRIAKKKEFRIKRQNKKLNKKVK
jgi:large subunit ribosomal protein L22